MADKNDPRPGGADDEPRPAADTPATDDPLAELARIVSGKPFGDAAPQPTRPTPRAEPEPTPPKPASDILGDLEAELLSNLQASFTAVDAKNTGAGTTATPSPTPDQPAPAEPPPATPDEGAPTPASPADPFRPAGVAPTQQPREQTPPTPSAPGATGAPPRPADPFAARTEPAPEAAAPKATRPDPFAQAFEDLVTPPAAEDTAPESSSPPAEPTTEAPADRRWPPRMEDVAADWAREPLPGTAAPATPRADQPGATPTGQPSAAPASGSAQQPAPPAAPSRPEAAAPETATPETPATPSPTGEALSETGQRSRPAFLGKRVDISSLPLRRTTEPTPPRDEHPRWEGAADATQAPSRFAPPPSAQEPTAAPPPPAEPGAYGAPPHERPPSDTQRAGPAIGGAARMHDGFSEEVAAAVVPDDFGLDQEDMLADFGGDNLDGLLGRRRPGLGLIAVAVVLALVVLGGGLTVFLLARGGGEPPVIAADTTPTRVDPPVAAAATDDQNKLIYDRVDPDGTGEGAIVLQPGAEQVTPPATGTDGAIARVILPDPTDGSIVPPDTAGASDLGTGTGDIVDPLGPRRVRTVVVRPDGTIVSNQADDIAGPAPSVTVSPTADDTLAIAGRDVLGEGTELAITPLPEDTPTIQVQPQQQTTLQPEPVVQQPVAQPPPAQVTPPQQNVAVQDPNAPLNLTPQTTTTTTTVVAPPPAAAAPQAPTASGGMLVQVSSQRSEDAARTTFRELQARYPRILGPYDIDIQRANLGERGIFFRVRVGPFSPADAQRLCDDLKAAGGDCLLSRS